MQRDEEFSALGIVSFPVWLAKLARRILHLPPGRYQLIITISDRPDWTVLALGPVENE